MKITCPHCRKELEVTSKGVECTGTNPFHIFRLTPDQIKSFEEIEKDYWDTILYGKNNPHVCKGKIPSFRCGEELYNNFTEAVRTAILKQKTNGEASIKLLYGTKGKVSGNMGERRV